MNLTDDILAATARLAALDLTTEERERLRGELSQILGYVELLDAVATPTGESTEGMRLSSLRADAPREGLARQEVLAQAPASDGETFSVPKVLEGG